MSRPITRSTSHTKSFKRHKINLTTTSVNSNYHDGNTLSPKPANHFTSLLMAEISSTTMEYNDYKTKSYRQRRYPLRNEHEKSSNLQPINFTNYTHKAIPKPNRNLTVNPVSILDHQLSNNSAISIYQSTQKAAESSLQGHTNKPNHEFSTKSAPSFKPDNITPIEEFTSHRKKSKISNIFNSSFKFQFDPTTKVGHVSQENPHTNEIYQFPTSLRFCRAVNKPNLSYRWANPPKSNINDVGIKTNFSKFSPKDIRRSRSATHKHATSKIYKSSSFAAPGVFIESFDDQLSQQISLRKNTSIRFCNLEDRCDGVFNDNTDQIKGNLYRGIRGHTRNAHSTNAISKEVECEGRHHLSGEKQESSSPVHAGLVNWRLDEIPHSNLPNDDTGSRLITQSWSNNSNIVTDKVNSTHKFSCSHEQVNVCEPERSGIHTDLECETRIGEEYLKDLIAKMDEKCTPLSEHMMNRFVGNRRVYQNEVQAKVVKNDETVNFDTSIASLANSLNETTISISNAETGAVGSALGAFGEVHSSAPDGTKLRIIKEPLQNGMKDKFFKTSNFNCGNMKSAGEHHKVQEYTGNKGLNRKNCRTTKATNVWKNTNINENNRHKTTRDLGARVNYWKKDENALRNFRDLKLIWGKVETNDKQNGVLTLDPQTNDQLAYYGEGRRVKPMRDMEAIKVRLPEEPSTGYDNKNVNYDSGAGRRLKTHYKFSGDLGKEYEGKKNLQRRNSPGMMIGKKCDWQGNSKTNKFETSNCRKWSKSKSERILENQHNSIKYVRESRQDFRDVVDDDDGSIKSGKVGPSKHKCEKVSQKVDSWAFGGMLDDKGDASYVKDKNNNLDNGQDKVKESPVWKPEPENDDAHLMGEWKAPPPYWEYRIGWVGDTVKRVKDWLEGSLNEVCTVKVNLSELTDLDYCLEIASRNWIPDDIEGLTPMEYWKSHIGSPLAVVVDLERDIKPWWERYKSDYYSTLTPLVDVSTRPNIHDHFYAKSRDIACTSHAAMRNMRSRFRRKA